MNRGSNSLLVGAGRRTSGIWPNALGSRLLRSKTRKTQLAKPRFGRSRAIRGAGSRL